MIYKKSIKIYAAIVLGVGAWIFVNCLDAPLTQTPEISLTDSQSTETNIPVAFTRGELGQRNSSLALKVKLNPDILQRAATITIPIATYGQTVSIESLELIEDVSNEIWFSGKQQWHEDNQKITLKRITPRDKPVKSNKNLSFEFVAHCWPESQIVAWAKKLPPRDQPPTIELTNSGGGGATIAMVGTWKPSESASKVTRTQALAYLWGTDLTKILVLAPAVVLLICGWLLLTSERYSLPAMAFMMISISLIYASIIPPFHAPDEPDHFLGLAQTLKSTTMSEEALKLAQTNHFEDIKNHEDAYFTADFIGKPSSASWPPYITPSGDLDSRSPVAAIIWPKLGSIVSSLSAGEMLLTLRVINVIALFLGYGLFLWFLPSRHRFIAGFLMLAIPTLPFFAMHWSNYNYLIVSSLVGCGILIRGSMETKMPPVMYLAWGAFAGICFVSGGPGVAGWLFSAIASTLLLIFTSSPRRALTSSILYVLSSTSIIFLVSDSSYWEKPIRAVTQSLPVRDLMGGYATFPILLSLGSVAQVLMTVLACGLMPYLHKVTRLSIQPWVQKISVGLFVIWIIFLAWTSQKGVCPVPDIEFTAHGLTPMQYGVLALKGLTKSLGLGPSEWYLTQTFWGGFGWLDAFPPQWFMRLVRLWPTIGISLWLWSFVQYKNPRQLWTLIGAIFALGLFVFILAIGSIQMPANLHGRYLIGFYLGLMSFSAIGYLKWFGNATPATRNKIRALIVTAVMATHLFCWRLLLNRYFGWVS